MFVAVTRGGIKPRPRRARPASVPCTRLSRGANNVHPALVKDGKGLPKALSSKRRGVLTLVAQSFDRGTDLKDIRRFDQRPPLCLTLVPIGLAIEDPPQRRNESLKRLARVMLVER